MFIAYNDGNRLAIITPCVAPGFSIHDVAQKDVPAGVPYRILTVDDIPSDGTYREAWELDFSEPDGVGIGEVAWLVSKGLFVE